MATSAMMVEENGFVDHVETKLLSPVRESFTPSKGLSYSDNHSKESDTEPSRGSGVVHQGTTESEVQATVKHELQGTLESELQTTTESEFIDSSSHEVDEEEHSVDGQESFIEAEDPYVVKSPCKVVDTVFSYINDEVDSLDAVNNNSELSVQCSDIGLDVTDINNSNYKTNQDSDYYLGKEVKLHDKGSDFHGQETGDNETNQAQVPNAHQDESAVNLYWYSSNLDVDPAELEAFRKSQNDSSFTSTANVTFQDGYYKGKLYDSERMVLPDSRIETTMEKPPEKEFLSTVLESVSSHCLDVASSLKSEPKTQKNIENTSIKESGANHPWGLEREEKVVEVSEARDELPFITSDIPFGKHVLGSKSSELYEDEALNQDGLKTEDDVEREKPENEWSLDVKADEQDGQVELDESDAVGYMELKDRDQIKAIKGNESDKQIEGQYDSSKLSKMKDQQLIDSSEHTVLDDSDAVGYMELKDKDEILRKMKNEVTSDSNDKQSLPKDQIDAVTFKEMKGDSVEEVISATENKLNFAPNSNSNFSTEPAENFAQDISKETVTSLSQQIHQDTDPTFEDHPDSTREFIVESMERKTESKTHSAPIEIDLSNPIDIKRKFSLSPDTENKIIEIGGTLIDTVLFVDEYLDDSSYSILIDDCWLRLRNKEFQMKLKSKSQNSNFYPETATESEIKEVLIDIFSKKSNSKNLFKDQPLDVLIDELGLTEFVTIETTRKTYQLNDFLIELDLTSLGPEVGDIAVVVDKKSKIVPQLEELDHIARQIGKDD